MATDYKKIAEEHRKRYGSDTEYRSFFYEQLYSEKTHFVYELIQNGDDNKSGHLELQLGENALLVWNDGCHFSEEDVRSICSLGLSNKDLTQIGTFGIGFKSVYNYTELPEIYSGEERFRIRDLTEPEGIDEIDPKITALVNTGKTVFCLPFKADESREDDIARLKAWLCNLADKRVLLFLRNLKKIQWSDERDGQTGFYSCHREPHTQMQNAYEVQLTVSLNDEHQLSETFLVFRKEIQPPQEVINELLRRVKNDKERQRIQRSAEKFQPVEVAFKLEDGRITGMKSCVLFAYLPTTIKTDLHFIIQARYQTTLARDNVQKDNPWNRWLVEETADFLPEILEQLKLGGFLEPAFFNIIPLKADPVPEVFTPISEALQKAMRDGTFVPTEDGGYAKAESVLYPDSEALRELIDSNWLQRDSNWLHPEIRNTDEFRQGFKVVQEAGVKIVGIGRVLGWLEEQDPDWFKSKSNEWLHSLYAYLKEQRSHLERIKRLPLVRLENGNHVCASDELVFFPPETDEERKEIALFLNELPIFQSDLLEIDEPNDIEGFLKNLGVLALNPADLIGKWIIPQYSRTDIPSKEQNSLHVGYLFKVWNKFSEYERRNLREKIHQTPILRAHNGVQGETYDFVKPCDAYLPKTYTGDDDLKTYFSVYSGDIWFIDDTYLDNNSNSKDWLRFLKAIGAMDTPRVFKVEVVGSCEECEKRGITRQRSTRPFENGSFVDIYFSGYFDGAIVDPDFEGLLEILDQISNYNEVNLSRALWSLLIKTVKPLSLEKPRWRGESNRDAFFQCTYHRFYHKPIEDSFDANFYRQLKETAWLPDEQGKLQVPANCFVPTDANRRLLGDSVVYLHPDFDVSQDNQTSQWLAEKLGIHLSANTGSVLHYLRTLRGAEARVEKVEPLYRFLARQDARPREGFKQKPLIFTSSPEPRWWRSDQVFWEDESAVFGNSRGFLKEDYADPAGTLKTFFHALGVSERAAPLDYVYGIKNAASAGQAEDAEVRKRVKTLYRRIMSYLREEDSFQEDEEWQEGVFWDLDSPEDVEWQEQWKQTCEGKCWLGKKGDRWDFFSRDELVWNDHPYIAEIFQDKVPFWVFDDDLLEFAKDQNIKGCSEADVTFHPSGDQEEDTSYSKKVQDLHPYIDAFLKSPLLCERHDEGKSVQILNRLSVCLVEELKMTYTLKEIPVTCSNSHPSALDTANQDAILWLALAADENEYPELIGDALQDYFRVKELGRFVEDLLTKDRNRVLSRWNQKGLRTDLYEAALEVDSKESEKNRSESVDGKPPDETDSGDDAPKGGESGDEAPANNWKPETGNGNGNSTDNGSKTFTYQPRPSGARTPPRHGGGSIKPGRSGGTGYSSGGGGEGEEHWTLKEDLANNPSLFGEGLKLIATEYGFKSRDEVDILFEDSSGNPVTVEVKLRILSGSDQEIWQAVKYQHLAAVEYGLPCEQVRSILAAQVIPDDVKEKCKQQGIEPFEVPQR